MIVRSWALTNSKETQVQCWTRWPLTYIQKKRRVKVERSRFDSCSACSRSPVIFWCSFGYLVDGCCRLQLQIVIGSEQYNFCRRKWNTLCLLVWIEHKVLLVPDPCHTDTHTYILYPYCSWNLFVMLRVAVSGWMYGTVLRPHVVSPWIHTPHFLLYGGVILSFWESFWYSTFIYAS